jgi:hypothetical protein
VHPAQPAPTDLTPGKLSTPTSAPPGAGQRPAYIALPPIAAYRPPGVQARMTLPIKPIEKLLGVELQPGVKRGPIAINLLLEEAGTGARVGADVAFSASISFRNYASPNAKPEPIINTRALRQQELQGWVRVGVRHVGSNTFALVLQPCQLAAGAGREASSEAGGAAGAPGQLQRGPAAGREGQGRQLTAGGSRAGTPRQRAAMAAAAAGGKMQPGGHGRFRPRAPQVSLAGQLTAGHGPGSLPAVAATPLGGPTFGGLPTTAPCLGAGMVCTHVGPGTLT